MLNFSFTFNAIQSERNGTFTDKEGQIIGNTEISRIVGQSVVHHCVRHPIESKNKKLFPNVRIRDQVHRCCGRRR